MFDFTDFARKIYTDRSRPEVDEEEPFILPAFYGGELPPAEEGSKFKALVVLQNPLFTYTKKQWGPPCDSVEEAIKKHRQIFFSWLPCNPDLEELFHHILGRKPLSPEDFFSLVYVTDIWKDCEGYERCEPEEERPEVSRLLAETA